MMKTKRGRVTETGTKVRQGRQRSRDRALSAKAAYNCELALEQRCRCRCRGRLHGARRNPLEIPADDPHAPAAAYCPGDCNCRWHQAELGPAQLRERQARERFERTL